MEKFSFKKVKFPSSLCLVCGVDSTAIKVFLFTVIGGLVLSSICFMVWALGSKRMDLKEDSALIPLEAERKKK